MSIEERIKRIEDAIKNAIDHRDWLRSVEWRQHRENNPELSQSLDDAVTHNESAIASYEEILTTLRAR